MKSHFSGADADFTPKNTIRSKQGLIIGNDFILYYKNRLKYRLFLD